MLPNVLILYTVYVSVDMDTDVHTVPDIFWLYYPSVMFTNKVLMMSTSYLFLLFAITVKGGPRK